LSGSQKVNLQALGGWGQRSVRKIMLPEPESAEPISAEDRENVAAAGTRASL
jgi:hypothetical protein